MTIQNLKPTHHGRRTSGVTLIELLIVISILSVITAIMIPRLRVINQDRNVREAARIVASAFAKASSRAVNDGSSGLVIVANPNFRNEGAGHGSPTTDVLFAGTQIFQMRRLPPYIGDDVDATAMITVSNGVATVTIDSPIEQSAGPIPIIRQYDSISFNGSSYRYGISNEPVPVGPLGNQTLALTLDLGSAPAPPPATAIPFVIHRQPRQLESSLVELPEGYMIDLRYSGAVIADAANDEHGTYLNQDAGGDVTIYFDSAGAVDRMFYADALRGGGGQFMELPQSSLFWFVSAYDPELNVAPASTVTPLDRPNSMWVTVNHLTGTVNVASSALPTHAVDFDGNGVTLADAIVEARAIANEKQSAAQ